jgi:hypothetical protein
MTTPISHRVHVLLPTLVFPQPQPTILSHYDVNHYYWILLSVVLNTWAEDEAYTLLAEWLENDWEWLTTEINPEYDFQEYNRLLEQFFADYVQLNHRVRALKASLNATDTQTITVTSEPWYDDACTHYVIDVF